MRVFKPQVTKPIPKGAKIIIPDKGPDKGKEIVQYKTHRKKRRAYKTSNGKMRVQTGKWHIEFRDHLDRKRRIIAYSSESQSRLLASNIEKLLSYQGQSLPKDLARFIDRLPEMIKNKLISFGMLEGKRTVAGRKLDELLEEFVASMKAQEKSKLYVYEVEQAIRRVFDDCGFKYFSDISANKVEVYLRELREGKRPALKNMKKGISYRRSNTYLKACKMFCNWLINRGYAYESPLQTLKELDWRLDRRHVRRALTPAELSKLLVTTAQSKEEIRGMFGYERYLLYRFVVETGLRRNEIAQLKKSSFDFDNNTVLVEANTAKGKRQDEQNISTDLSRDIKAFLSNKLPESKAFGGRYQQLTDKTAPMIRKDLKAAGIPYKDETGRVFDFHALRGQCATMLAYAGVNPKEAQEIMRHKDINLTMNVYTHTLRGQKAKAVASLPDMSLDNLQKQTAVKTGTDDANVTNESLRKVCFHIDQHNTISDNIGQVNGHNEQKTALVCCSKGSVYPTEPKVRGSNTFRRIETTWRIQLLQKKSKKNYPGLFRRILLSATTHPSPSGYTIRGLMSSSAISACSLTI